MRLTAVLTGCVLSAIACSPQAERADAPASPAPPFNAEIDVEEVMVHAMDPAARAFWAGWGEVYDNAGSHDVSAQTLDEWKKVEDGAAMVVLTTNTLMLPEFQRKPETEWVRWAKEVADLAMQGKQAAEAQDTSAVELIGGKLDQACDACHSAFRTEK